METVVYIHGVVGERVRQRTHRSQYRAMHTGLIEHGVALPPFDEAVEIEWGWDTDAAGATRTLELAQRAIQDRIDEATPRDRTSLSSLLFAPAIDPVRMLLTLGWSDLIYYVGDKGKRRTREVVWGEIFRKVGVDWHTDITIIAHSAGSLIALDFLYWLFSGRRDHELSALDELPDDVAITRARESWRIRRFVTFGSSIAPMLVRSADVVDTLAGPGRPTLSVEPLGLTRPGHDGRDPLWLNVWDRHDVLSYPVEPFYTGGKVQDLYPDHSDSLLGGHDAYFEAESVHRMLAAHWDD